MTARVKSRERENSPNQGDEDSGGSSAGGDISEAASSAGNDGCSVGKRIRESQRGAVGAERKALFLPRIQRLLAKDSGCRSGAEEQDLRRLPRRLPPRTLRGANVGVQRRQLLLLSPDLPWRLPRASLPGMTTALSRLVLL